MKGLRSRDEHLKLGLAAGPLRLVTFGLSERNIRLRGLNIVSKQNIVANIDNNKNRQGKSVWDIDTIFPNETDIPAFLEKNDISHVVIMSDAVGEISRQLDSMGVKEYYSSALIKELLDEKDNSWRKELMPYDPILMEVMKNLKEPIQRCHIMEESLIIGHGVLLHCCGNNLLGYDAKICDFEGGKFPVDTYNRSFREIVLQNMAGIGNCKGCATLQYGFPNIWHRQINKVVVNLSHACQLKCNYCIIPDFRRAEKNEKVYPAWTLIQDLIDAGILGHNANVLMSGGEPTLYKYFDDTVEFCLNNKITVDVQTNAVIFSELIGKILSAGLGSILCDTDSGTRETYKLVKGADCHGRVWENIMRYRKCGRVVLKYIITKDNASQRELSAFIEKCKGAGIDEIIISSLIEKNRPALEDDILRRSYLESAAFLYKEAVSNGINVQSLLYFNDKEAGFIKQQKIITEAQ